MVLTENKVKSWTVKYGNEQKVQQLLDQYKNFVSRNKIFQEFNKAFVDMQHVVEEYKAEGNIGKLSCVVFILPNLIYLILFLFLLNYNLENYMCSL